MKVVLDYLIKQALNTTLFCLEASLELGVGSGVVIGVPPNLACNGCVHPDTPSSDLGQEIEAAIQQALKEAR